MDASKELAHRLAQAAPIAAEFTKQLVDRGLELKSTLEYETYFQNICFQTEDVQEGIKSFLEKRTPVFKGK
jgi:enoyl-CoA hydratase/carnithine racemase